MMRHRLAIVIVAILASAAVGFSAQVTETSGNCPKGSVNIKVGTSIEKASQGAPDGAVFCIRAGVHRMQSIFPKSKQQFIGQPGAVLNGSMVVTGFRKEADRWRVKTKAPQHKRIGTCLPTSPNCNVGHGVFIDNIALMPAASLEDLKPGSFFLDPATSLLWLADNPAGKTVEMAVAERAFHPSASNGVVIRNLIVEKYANPAQQGAIAAGRRGYKAIGWTVENNEIRLNVGVGIAAGPDSIIRGNNIHHNGQLGITSTATNVLIENNDITNNNTYGYDSDWEAGGLKAALAEKLTIRANRVTENRGAGIWCDIDCKQVVIEENTVERNASPGIFYEISSDGIIRNNYLNDNATGAFGQKGRVWVWGAEILIAASSRVEVSGNKVHVGDGASGVMLVEQGRKKAKEVPGVYQDSDGYFITSNVDVHHNEIVYLGPKGESGGVTDLPDTHPNAKAITEGNNRFDYNSYVSSPSSPPQSADRFRWGSDPMTFDAFRATGNEAHGTFVEK